jgi:hypothetical protein
MIVFGPTALAADQWWLSKDSFSTQNAIIPGVPAVVFFWVLRAISRMMNDHESLCNDAGTRVAMVQTLSALQAEGTAGDGDKGLREAETALALEALFRPPRRPEGRQLSAQPVGRITQADHEEMTLRPRTSVPCEFLKRIGGPRAGVDFGQKRPSAS